MNQTSGQHAWDVLSFYTVMVVCSFLVVSSQSVWAQSQPVKPATAVQAAAVLDLSRFELIDPSGVPNFQVIAGQSYLSKGNISDVSKSLREKLKKAGCEELEAATFTNEYGSAFYRKAGFSFSLSVSPGPGGEGTSVTLMNHGNVNLISLPIPKDSKLLYSLPSMVMYTSTTAAEKVQQEILKKLTEGGWELFGETTVSTFVKQNAVRLQVMVSKDSVDANKTSIQITSDQLSVDLPAPPYSGTFQFTDQSGGMLFDSEKTQEELVTYFKKSLAKWGWEATTEATIRIAFGDHLIFRNPKEEYLELRFSEFEGKRRVDLKYQTAEQFAAAEKQSKELAEKKKMENAPTTTAKGTPSIPSIPKKPTNPSKIAISAPDNAKTGMVTPNKLDFSTNSGAATAIVANWLKAREAEGWKIDKIVETKEAGVYKLSQEGRELHVDYVDPGFIPGRISIKASDDFQLELKK